MSSRDMASASWADPFLVVVLFTSETTSTHCSVLWGPVYVVRGESGTVHELEYQIV